MFRFKNLPLSSTKIYSSSINQLIKKSIINSQFNLIVRSIQKIDRSKFPVLNEKDLEESFINGSGPGGQNVNKRINCVFLKHSPTKLFVKCHEHRELESNRKKARKLLLIKIDNHLNGDQSVEAQKNRIKLELEKKKFEQLKLKREKKIKLKEYLNSLKEEANESTEIDNSSEIELIKQLDRLNESNSKKSNS